MEENNEVSDDLSVLFCCNQCKGIFHSKEAYIKHKAMCDGSVHKSPCSQFICDKKSLMNENDNPSLHNTDEGPAKRKRKNEETELSDDNKKGFVCDEELSLKRPKRASAMKFLIRYSSTKELTDLKDEKDHSSVSDKIARKTKVTSKFSDNSEQSIRNTDKKELKSFVAPEETLIVDVLNKETLPGAVKLEKESPNMEESEDKKEEEEAECDHSSSRLMTVKLEVDDPQKIEGVLESGAQSVAGIEKQDLSEKVKLEEPLEAEVHIRNSNKQKKSKELRRRWMSRMDKCTIAYIKSGKLANVPEVKQEPEISDTDDNDYSDNYLMINDEPPQWKLKQLAGQPMWSVEYRLEKDRLKEIYSQFYKLPDDKVKFDEGKREKGRKTQERTNISQDTNEKVDTSQGACKSVEVKQKQSGFDHKNTKSGQEGTHKDTESGQEETHKDTESGQGETHKNTESGQEKTHKDTESGQEESHKDAESGQEAKLTGSDKVEETCDKTAVETNTGQREVNQENCERGHSRDVKDKKLKNRIIGYYKCPNCPVELKKTSSFHRHMTVVHNFNANLNLSMGRSKYSMFEDSSEEEIDQKPKMSNIDQFKFNHLEKFNPDKHISRQFYKRRRVEWAIQYEKYVVRKDDLFSHYQCPACDYKSEIIGHFHRHISRIHTAEDGTIDNKVEHWKCDRCSFATFRKQTLKQHYLVHERPFLCEYCPRRFGNKKNLRDHVMLHEGVNPRQCPFCPYNTRQKRCLQEHIRKHTGELLSCTFCDFRTAYYTGMKTHLLTKHRDKSLYPCSRCSYVTNDKSSYSKHCAIHRGEKNFQCSQCDFKSITQYDVIKHMKSVHENQKLYFCDQCDYSSAYSTAFRNHIMIHLDLKPYSCSLCDYAAPQKTRVDAHVRTKHATGAKAYTVSSQYQECKVDISKYRRPSTKLDLVVYNMKSQRPSKKDSNVYADIQLAEAASIQPDPVFEVNHAPMNVVRTYDIQGQRIEVIPGDNTETLTLRDDPYKLLKSTMFSDRGSRIPPAQQFIRDSRDPNHLLQVIQQGAGDNQVVQVINELAVANSEQTAGPGTVQMAQQTTHSHEPGRQVQLPQIPEAVSEQSVASVHVSEPEVKPVIDDGVDEKKGPVYTYQIVDPHGDVHLVEVSHPLGVDENIVFVTEPAEDETPQQFVSL